MSISFRTLEKNTLRDYILTAAAAIFLAMGKMSGEFPLFVFLGIAPLFSLFYNQQKEGSAKRPLIIKIFIVLLFAFLCWNLTYSGLSFIDWLLPIVYSLAIALSFVFYSFTDKYAKSRLGFLTFVIYWLAIEFLMLQVCPEFSRFFLATAFNEHSSLISWNIHTGFMGVSLWILLVNILFYHAIFKDDAIFNGNIKWRKMAFTLVIICVPFFFNTGGDAIIRQDLLQGLPAMEKQISGSGEYIGKTATWVSILLLLYSFVKREIKK
ncbi:MAG: hypothetical protein WD555_03350 [Fulvivirga sp.]